VLLVETDDVLLGAPDHQHFAQHAKLLFSRKVGQHFFLQKFILDRTIKSHARWTNGIYCVMGGVVKGKPDDEVQRSKFNVQGPKTNRNIELGTLNLEHRCASPGSPLDRHSVVLYPLTMNDEA
jgi:hypothetical protein